MEFRRENKDGIIIFGINAHGDRSINHFALLFFCIIAEGDL